MMHMANGFAFTQYGPEKLLSSLLPREEQLTIAVDVLDLGIRYLVSVARLPEQPVEHRNVFNHAAAVDDAPERGLEAVIFDLDGQPCLDLAGLGDEDMPQAS